MNAKVIAIAAFIWMFLVGIILAETDFRPSSTISWIALVVFGPPAYVLVEGAGELAMRRLSPVSEERKRGPGSVRRGFLLVAVGVVVVIIGVPFLYVFARALWRD